MPRSSSSNVAGRATACPERCTLCLRAKIGEWKGGRRGGGRRRRLGAYWLFIRGGFLTFGRTTLDWRQTGQVQDHISSPCIKRLLALGDRYESRRGIFPCHNGRARTQREVSCVGLFFVHGGQPLCRTAAAPRQTRPAYDGCFFQEAGLAYCSLFVSAVSCCVLRRRFWILETGSPALSGVCFLFRGPCLVLCRKMLWRRIFCLFCARASWRIG